MGKVLALLLIILLAFASVAGYLYLAVVPDPRTAGPGSSIRRDGDLFGKHQAKAAGGPRTHQHDVEVSDAAVATGAIHRHRRHGDAVAQGDVFERERAEQVGHAPVIAEVPERC